MKFDPHKVTYMITCCKYEIWITLQVVNNTYPREKNAYKIRNFIYTLYIIYLYIYILMDIY